MWTALHRANPVRQAGSMKELVYDLKPILAVNEGPDYENKNYEEKTLSS
jgi:hypothetical protein